MGRKISLREPGPADLQRAGAQDKGAYAGGSGMNSDASLQLNVKVK